jgi:hypothetical protein
MSEAKVRDPQDQEQQAETPKIPTTIRPPARLRVRTGINAGAEVENNGSWSN